MNLQLHYEPERAEKDEAEALHSIQPRATA